MVAPAGNLKPPLDPLMRKSAKPFIWREYFYDQDDPDAPQFGMKGSDKVRRRKELNDYPEYFVEPQATFTNYYHPALKSLTLDREYFPGSIYEYYSVMWVEWENGIAYRKGLARIAKGVFERECLGWMDVTLG
ncbi:hypothetical protein B0A48_12157 [Cryoendolithus antarcticus]|uniref:Uncharacterized protein n=1 Tax=Cryoendolithus antarcticus TaxID=1507870 RepID=A0A1V8SU78_9PEZI|nr:hypothetical protein B0A48_12157 [Cryoendolithus antarcticus]